MVKTYSSKMRQQIPLVKSIYRHWIMFIKLKLIKAGNLLDVTIVAVPSIRFSTSVVEPLMDRILESLSFSFGTRHTSPFPWTGALKGPV